MTRVRRLAPGLTAAALLAGAVTGTPFAHPVRADTSGSIVVHVTGDRDPATGVASPLSGVVVRSFTDESAVTAVGECTTDPSGACTIGGLADGTYWVAPIQGPHGEGRDFDVLERVHTSTGGDVRYGEAVAVGEGTPSTRTFTVSRANPPFPERCGIALTLLYDLSGSISPDEAAIMKRDSLAFVDALAGSPSSIAVASFATTAPAAGNVDLRATAVADPIGTAAVKQAIGDLTLTSGDDHYTNWDAALRAVAADADLVVMFTDGNPTTYGVPAVFPPVTTDLDQIEAGISSANAAKARGARVLAVGVGDEADISAYNLRAISGPTEDTDYAITTFADVDRVFADLADRLCRVADAPPVTVAPPAPQPVTPRFTG